MEPKHILKNMNKVVNIKEERGKYKIDYWKRTLTTAYDRLVKNLTTEEIEKLDKTIEVLEDYEKFKKFIENLQEDDINITWDTKDYISSELNREEISLNIKSIYIIFNLSILRNQWKIICFEDSLFDLDRYILNKLIGG